MKRAPLLLLLALLLAGFSSCKKDDPPRLPALEFKSASGYISSDAVVGTGDTLRVKVVATKTDYDLHLLYVGYAYDGVSLPFTTYTYNVKSSEKNSLEKDYTIITRNTAGNERWVFSVNDTEGHTAEIEIKLRVQ